MEYLYRKLIKGVLWKKNKMKKRKKENAEKHVDNNTTIFSTCGALQFFY